MTMLDSKVCVQESRQMPDFSDLTVRYGRLYKGPSIFSRFAKLASGTKSMAEPASAPRHLAQKCEARANSTCS